MDHSILSGSPKLEPKTMNLKALSGKQKLPEEAMVESYLKHYYILATCQPKSDYSPNITVISQHSRSMSPKQIKNRKMRSVDAICLVKK